MPTDVGGAYRWDDQRQESIPLTDWSSPAQNNFTGIESIGLDPSDSIASIWRQGLT